MSARPRPASRLPDDAMTVASNCLESTRTFGLEMIARFHAAEVCLVVNGADGVVFTATYPRPISRTVRAMASALPDVGPAAPTLANAALDATGAHVMAESHADLARFAAYLHPRPSVLASSPALGFDHRLAERYLAHWHEAWLQDHLARVQHIGSASPSTRFRIRFAGNRTQLWVEQVQAHHPLATS